MARMKLLYFTNSKGVSPVRNDILRLSKSQQEKVNRAIQPILEFGVGSHLIHTKKLVGTPLWEIRILGKDSIRVLYVTELSDIVMILHVFIKKSQKTPGREIGVAMKRLQEIRLS